MSHVALNEWLCPLVTIHLHRRTPTISALRQTHACSNSNASIAKPMAFALSHTLAPTSGTISPKTSGYSLFLQKPTQDIFLLRIFQLSHIVLHPYQSVRACVCVYVWACIFCLVMLEPLLMSTLCVSFFFLTADNIFHLNALYVCYTMLVQRFEPQGRRFTNFH